MHTLFIWTFLSFLACSGKDDTDETDPGDTDETDDTDVLPEISDEAKAEIEDAATVDLRNSNATGAQIAVWRDGSLLYTVQYGTVHPDEGGEIGVDTLFQIGSDTKKLTAIGLLQQEAAGNLALTDTVADAIPGFSLERNPEWASQATLHDLISHQGGLYDYTPWTDAPADSDLHDRAFGVFAENEPAFAPGGSFWNYSNPNFAMAGLALETAAGRPYADILEDDIFAPLGLTHTFARKSEAVEYGDYATGAGIVGEASDPFNVWGPNTFEFGTLEMEDVTDNGFIRPAGLVWSTASDTARFGGFLIDGNEAVLPAAQLAKLTEPHVRLYPSYADQSYGYGLFVVRGIGLMDGYHDVPVWIHGGNTYSFTSTFYVLPEQHIAVSILSNGYGDDFSGTVATLLAELGDLPPVTEQPPISMVETDHSELVGNYTDPQLGDVTITDEDGVLKIAIPGLEAMDYTVGSKLTFIFTDVYTFKIDGSAYDLTFIKDDSGNYQWAVNRAIVGTRANSLGGPTHATRARRDVDLALVEMRRMNALNPLFHQP